MVEFIGRRGRGSAFMPKCLHSRRQMYRYIRLHNIPCQPHATSLFSAGETLRIRVQSLAMYLIAYVAIGSCNREFFSRRHLSSAAILFATAWRTVGFPDSYPQSDLSPLNYVAGNASKPCANIVIGLGNRQLFFRSHVWSAEIFFSPMRIKLGLDDRW